MECGTPGGRIAATLQSSPSKALCVPACAPSPDKARPTMWLRTLSLPLFMARLLLAWLRHRLGERVAGPPPRKYGPAAECIARACESCDRFEHQYDANGDKQNVSEAARLYCPDMLPREENTVCRHLQPGPTQTTVNKLTTLRAWRANEYPLDRCSCRKQRFRQLRTQPTLLVGLPAALGSQTSRPYSGSATNRYPTPRTVCKCFGCDGSSSMYRRSRTTKLSMARVSVSSCNPQTSSKIDLRETTRPSLRTRYRSSSASITVRWIVFPSVRSSRSPKSIDLPAKLNVSPPASRSPNGAGRALSPSGPAPAGSASYIHTLRRSKLSS